VCEGGTRCDDAETPKCRGVTSSFHTQKAMPVRLAGDPPAGRLRTLQVLVGNEARAEALGFILCLNQTMGCRRIHVFPLLLRLFLAVACFLCSPFYPTGGPWVWISSRYKLAILQTITPLIALMLSRLLPPCSS